MKPDEEQEKQIDYFAERLAEILIRQVQEDAIAKKELDAKD
jgi:hypothetical protein